MFLLRTSTNQRALKQMGGKTGFVSVRVPTILRRKIDLMCESYRLDKATVIQDVLLALTDYVASEGKYRWPVKIVYDQKAAEELARAQAEVRAILRLKDPSERLRRLLGMDYVQQDKPDPGVNDPSAELFREAKRRIVPE